jgi:hypothetical protein
MSTTKQKQTARAGIKAKRTELIEAHQDSKLSDGANVKNERELVLGPPVLGEPWPDGIEIAVGFQSEADATRTRRSFGLRGRASRRLLIALILTLTLSYAATHSTHGKMTRLVKSIIQTLK